MYYHKQEMVKFVFDWVFWLNWCLIYVKCKKQSIIQRIISHFLVFLVVFVFLFRGLNNPSIERLSIWLFLPTTKLFEPNTPLEVPLTVLKLPLIKFWSPLAKFWLPETILVFPRMRLEPPLATLLAPETALEFPLIRLLLPSARLVDPIC